MNTTTTALHRRRHTLARPFWPGKPRRYSRRGPRPCHVRALIQVSSTARTGSGQWIAETIATFGLLTTIFGGRAASPQAVPYAVGLYITAAYWFTASTSFANPAVTIARAFSDTFAGIAPASVLAFIAAQLLGAMIALAAASHHWPRRAD